MSSIERSQSDDLPLVWPRRGENAFVEVEPFRGAWVANRADERLYRMIKGFHEAGDLLVAESKAEPDRAQNLIYPATFAYCQALELRLKYILIEFGPMSGEMPGFRTHSLPELWLRCRRVIEFFDRNLRPADLETFRAVEGQIAEFDAVDPGSDAFRFAHDTKGRPIKLGLNEVDLANLRKVVASLLSFLECVGCHLRYTVDMASA
jgi:hypothetical protein